MIPVDAQIKAYVDWLVANDRHVVYLHPRSKSERRVSDEVSRKTLLALARAHGFKRIRRPYPMKDREWHDLLVGTVTERFGISVVRVNEDGFPCS